MAFFMRSLVAAAALAAFAALFSTPTQAAPSTANDDPPLQDAGIISVAPVQGRNYRIEASLGALYNDNFRRTVVKQSATRLRPSISGAIGFPVGRQQLFFGGEIGRDIFLNNSVFNRNRYGVGGGLDWRLGSRCTGEVAGEYRRRQNLVTEVAELVDNVQVSKIVGGSANCRVGVGIGFGGSIVHRETDNNRLQRQLFNTRTTTFSPQISYGSPALGQFSVGGSFNKVRYPNRSVLTTTGNVGDGVNIVSGRFGYQRALGSRLQLGLGASYIKADPRPASQVIFTPAGAFVVPRNGYSGLGYDGSLGYTPSPRIAITLSANKSVNSTANVGALFLVSKTYGADLNYKVGPSITAGFGGTLNKRDYRGSFASADEPNRRISDEVTRIYAQVGYSPVPLYSVQFEVAHQNRNSNPAQFDFKDTTALVTLRVKLGRG